MIRRLNFTGRKKIPKSQVSITLLNLDKYPQSFDAQLDLSNMDLPSNAFVYIEAYRRTSYMRFSFGTIGNLQIPSNRELKDIEPGVIPLFRIKVVDKSSNKGRIIALADKIVPKGINQESKDKISLLYVEFSEELDGQIWKLDLDDDWPIIKVNSRVETIKEIARSDINFIALVYPEVVRQILRSIIEPDNLDPSFDEDDWPSLWLKYVSRLPGVGSPPPNLGLRQEKEEWVENAVQAFGKKRNLLEQYKEFHNMDNQP